MWDDAIKAVLAFGTGLGAAAFGYQKYAVAQSKKDVSVASDDAIIAQLKSMQDAIDRLQKQVIELQAVQQIMDRKVHQQQRTITRMEMLIRQFSGLVRQHGIEVPQYMQVELEELITADAERRETPEPKVF